MEELLCLLRRSDEPQKMKEKENTLSKEITAAAAARLAQLVKRRSAKRKVAWGSNPGRTNAQGLKITEENVLPLVRHSSLLG